MDDQNINSGIKTSKKSDWHIESISKTLLSAEAAELWVGIPILPPSAQRSVLLKSYFEPLSEFVKCNLVSVPTQILLIVDKALDPFSRDNDIDEEFKTTLEQTLRKSFSDRIFFPLLSGTLVFLLVLGSIIPLSFGISNAFFAASTAGLGGALAGSLFTLEGVRHLSFKKVIERELARRQGKFGETSSLPIKIPVMGSLIVLAHLVQSKLHSIQSQ